MKFIYAALAVIIAIIAVPMVMSPSPDNHPGKPVEGLPWQIDVMPDGSSRVSGLTLGVSKLSDARTRFGEGELAIVAAPDEQESLEMYFRDATLGVITGKLIVTAEVDAATLAAMHGRTTRTEYMNSNTRKSALADQDMPMAFAAPIRAITFVPSINLDDASVMTRFGAPVERIRTSDKIEHFLYPDRGLDVIVDSDAKELLQYVAPRDFMRLREPLKSVEGAKP
jgi:hypothetical protein